MNSRGEFSNNRFYNEVREDRRRIFNAINQRDEEQGVDILNQDLPLVDEILNDEDMPVELVNEILADENMPVILEDEELSERDESEFEFSTDEDNSSDNSEEEIENVGEVDDAFKNQLATFVRTFNVSCKGVKALLTLLRENGHSGLPKNRQTLLGTPKHSIHPRVCSPGEYHHYGLQKCLQRSNFSFLDTIDVVKIDINIDGVSLSKSSRLKMWPILGAFVDQPNISPFLIGCYYGNGDPESTDDYIKEFVNEIKELSENGCKVTPREILKPLEIRVFTCDMPGRSFVKGVKGHQSKFGCDKCNQECVTIARKMTYLTVAGEERTDETFRNRSHIQHHQPQYLRMRSRLEESNLGMVSQFVIDDMHAIHLGVTKRMLQSIFFTRPCHSLRLTDLAKEEFDEKYQALSCFIPSEFERKPRSILKELPGWKAVEYRLFLLYTGIVFLKDGFPPALYKHFLQLSSAVRYLSARATSNINAAVSQLLLKNFVADYPRIYSPTELVYNVHCLLHIVSDVRQYGPLSSFSAYKFENHQRELKKHVKKPSKVLQQIYNRIEEINIINEKNVNVNGLIGVARQVDNDIFPGCNSSYKGFKYGSFILKNNLRDSSCLHSSGVPLQIQWFTRVNGAVKIIAKKFLNPRNFFTEPQESLKDLGIMLVDPPGDELFMFDQQDVKHKFVRLPYRDYNYVLIPMLHHIS